MLVRVASGIVRGDLTRDDIMTGNLSRRAERRWRCCAYRRAREIYSAQRYENLATV